ncbi:hypothetical protein FRB94_013262 [Tulasnella sp. JGI-2019a]|nr:hypothetical protein FRB93_001968 [Tulasnella sp. JGI-2019a]KAG9008438.1 hypothetical protein FRB94_013262 [Tulasnella sp. JGI-2019a]KAG9031443.1 hypothetical protein FRB95_002743 [Tulasnella sp. JGI-2019a]
MAGLERITFEGKDTEDVTLFLQNVKRIAFMQGRQRDDGWLADYVETCLSGEALLWYIPLDEDFKRNFSLLRIAMVEHFAAPATPDHYIPAAAPVTPTTPNHFIPTAAPVIPATSDYFIPTPAPLKPVTSDYYIPAAAPPKPVTLDHLIPTDTRPTSSFSFVPVGSPPPQWGRGRIKMVRRDGRFPGGYCGQERFSVPLQRWECDRTSEVSDAIIVEVWRSSIWSHKLLKVVSDSETRSDQYLGVGYCAEDNGAINPRTDFWTLCLCDKGVANPHPRSRRIKGIKWPAASWVWTMDENTRELSATWVGNTGDTSELDFRIHNDSQIWLRSVKNPTVESNHRVSLYFEPL